MSATTSTGGGGGGAGSGNMNEIVDVITGLGATFTKLIELMLSKEIKVSILNPGEILSYITLYQ